jgi:hypothetical protein
VWCLCGAAAQVNIVNEDKLWFLGTNYETETIFWRVQLLGGPGTVVGIATGYGLDDSGIESRWGARFSAPVQTAPAALPTLLYNGYWLFPGGKERPGRDSDPSPPSSANGPYGLYRASVPVQ